MTDTLSHSAAHDGDAPEAGPRIDYRAFADGLRALLRLSQAVSGSGIEPSLRELIRMRASQLNGCAYCLDLHSTSARAAGESEQRLHVLAGWREAPTLYTPREQAALALTEAVTLLPVGGVDDAVLAQAEAQFDAEELQALLFAIVEINAWNRLAVTGRTPLSTPAATEPTGRAARAAAP